jgi:hypothetical protein
LYPEEAPRPGVDIDVLVRKCDFEESCSLLGTIIEAVPPSNERMATHSTLFERVFSAKNTDGPIVEIHRALTKPDTLEQFRKLKASIIITLGC